MASAPESSPDFGLTRVPPLQASTAALSWVLRHLYRPGDLLDVLTVVPEAAPARPWTGVYAPPDADAAEDAEVAEVRERFKAVHMPVLLAARAPFRLHVVIGALGSTSIADVVREEAAVLHAAAVVLGVRHKSALQALWEGSVSGESVRKLQARCTVVLVPHE